LKGVVQKYTLATQRKVEAEGKVAVMAVLRRTLTNSARRKEHTWRRASGRCPGVQFDV
jgi:hypothetical protein